MKRRQLLVGAAVLACAGPGRGAQAVGLSGVPASGMLAFDVIRKGSQIGTHTMRFTQSGGLLTIRTDVEMAVGIGPLTLYRYQHHAVETWQAGAFATLDTRTNDDGTAHGVRAVRGPAGVRIDATRNGTSLPTLLLAATTLPLTHWNIAVTRAPLFDPQDGGAALETVTPRGSSPLPDGQGPSADRFDFAGKATLSDWYDDRLLWTALRAKAKDGSLVDYRQI